MSTFDSNEGEVRRDLHSNFLTWARANHSPDDAQAIISQFVHNGLYPDQFLQLWRNANEQY
jgi:hypothetical protein